MSQETPTEKTESETPFVHEFTGPHGVKYKVKILGKDDATFFGPSSKRIIVGPGIVMEESTGMSFDQWIVCGCKVVFLADNYAEAARLAEEKITC